MAPSKEPVTKRNVKEFMLLKLQAAKQKVNHIPYIVSNHRKMAVWSDVKEVLFMSCLNPKCTVVLNALKHRLDFPASETHMHPCTQTEQLLFLRQFIIVAPGTLLVDVSCLQNLDTLMKLHDMVSVKHQKSKESNTQQCNHMAKLKERDSVCLGNNKSQQLKILGKRRFLPAVIRDGPKLDTNFNIKTTPVESKAEEDVGLAEKSCGMDRPGGNYQKTELSPLISTILCSQDDKQAEKALVPLALLKEVFPEYLSVLEEVAHTYVRQCAKDVSCVTQCSGEEGQKLTTFLTLYKGNDKHWFCLTSLSLMMSWAEFWKCCRCESTKKRDNTKCVSVCVLNMQKQTTGVPKLDYGNGLLKEEQTERKQDGPSLSDRLDRLENATSRSDLGSKNGPATISSDTKVKKSLQERGKVPSSKTAVLNLMKQSQQSKYKLKESMSEGSLSNVNVNRTAAKLLNKPSSQKLSGKTDAVDDKIKKRHVSRETTDKPIQSKSDTGRFVNSKPGKDLSAQTTVGKSTQFEKDNEKNVTLSQKKETDSGKKKHIKSSDHVMNNKAGKVQRKNESQNTKTVASGKYPFSKNDPAKSRKTLAEEQKVKKPYNSKMQPGTNLIKALKQKNTQSSAKKIDSELNSLSNKMQNNLILSDLKRHADETSPVRSIGSENRTSGIQVEGSASTSKNMTLAEVKTNIGSVGSKSLPGQTDRNSNAKLKENDETEPKVSTEEKEMQNLSVSVNKAKENASRFQFKEYLEALYDNAIHIPQQNVTKEQTDFLHRGTDVEGASKPPLLNGEQTKFNRVSDDEDGRTELCSGHMSGPSTDVKLNPQLHIRPSTAEARKPKAPSSGSIGSKNRSKSAVTQVTQNGIVPAAYYSSPRPNLMLKTSQMNPVPVSSVGKHRLMSSNCQDMPNLESVTKATQSSAENKVNTSSVNKHLRPGTIKGYKSITESTHDEVIKKWRLMNKSKLNKNVVNERKLVDREGRSERTEQRSDDKTADSAALRRNGSPRVTPAVLHRVKQLQEQFGDMQLQKKELGINGQKPVTNKQYLNAKGMKDKDKVVDNKQSTKGHDYIVVPYGAFQASVNVTKPKHIDEGSSNTNNEVQTSKSPCFGSSTSCTPDIYDGYARKTKPKPNKADPSLGKKGNPNNIAVKDKEQPLNNKVCPERGTENSYVKYVHSKSPDELHKPNLPFNSCDKLFKDLIALCEKNYSKYESKTSDSEQTSSCSHCALCKAEAMYSPEDQILNQLAYHMLERMKSLKIDCVDENAEKSFSTSDKPVMSVALMSRSGSRVSEKAAAQDEDNSTIPRKLSLLDKVSSFAERSFDEEEEYCKDNSQRETKDSQSNIETSFAETSLDKANQNQLEAPSEFQLKVKDFFVPIEQPIYYRVSDNGPFIPVKESFPIPDNAELYYRDTVEKTPDPCTEQGDTQLEVKNSSDVSISTDPDALEGSEIIKSYQDNPRLYGQFSKLDKREKRKQDLADRVCSPTNINLKLHLKEKSNVGLVNSTVYLRNAVETKVGIPEKAKQCLDCQMSASKSALHNVGIKPVADESGIARNKTNETVTSKSDVNQDLHEDRLSGCTNISLKPRPKSSARCGKRFKTSPVPRAKEHVPNTYDTNSGLSDIFRVAAAETHMHVSADIDMEEKQSREPISLRQRTSKSAKTAQEKSENQVRERGRRFAERQKRQGSNGVLAAVSSIARNTFESVPQEGTSSVKFQSRQNKLRKHIQSKMKNKNKVIRKRKINSAPPRKHGQDLISNVSGEDKVTDLNQVAVNMQPMPVDLKQSEITKTAKCEKQKKHVRSGKLKASHCKRKSKAGTTDKNETVIKSCGINFNTDDELRQRKSLILDQSSDAVDMISTGYEEKRNKEAEAISEATEESNSVNANLNNNVCDTLNTDEKELNKIDISKETECKKVVRSKLPNQKKRVSEDTADDMSDAEQENAEIEIDVDEVVDWEQQYDNSTNSVDEITFTITHVDGTQLIVSNKHPDFENIVRFIEEQKRNCGDESISVEAEVNYSPNEVVEENVHGTSALILKPEADVQQTFDESENHFELTNLVIKDKTRLDEIEICPFMPLQNIDDVSGKETESYSICNAFRDIIPQELIIQCFMNEEGDMKENSSFTGKDYKHHDNIFEALAPGIWTSVESVNLLGRNEKGVGDSKAVSIYTNEKAKEAIAELPSCKKKTLLETENQNDCYTNSVSLIKHKDNALDEKVEEHDSLSPEKLAENVDGQYKMQDHQMTSETSDIRNGSTETLAMNNASLIYELPAEQLMVSGNEVKPPIKEEDDEQIYTTSADELNELSDTSTLLGDLHSTYPEVRCSELLCNLENKSQIDVRSEGGAITTLRIATAQEQQNPDKKKPSVNYSTKLILEGENYPNSTDGDNTNSETGIDGLGLNENVESSTGLYRVNCDQDRLSESDDIQSDQEKLTTIQTEQQLQTQKRRKHNKQKGESVNVMLKDIMKHVTDKEEHQYPTKDTDSVKKKASVNSSNEVKGYLRSRKKSMKPEYEEEDEEEEEKRREKEEQIAAEGFIKTQQKYMEVILNSSIEVQKEKGRTEDCKVETPRNTSPRASEFAVENLPEGMPVHGDRQCYRASTSTSNTIAADSKENDDNDEGTWIEDASNSCRYQLIDDEDGMNLGGLAFFKDWVFPYVYINGYKFTPLREALQCFRHCQPACTIPRSVLNQHKGLVKSLSTWDQVYKLELIMMKTGHSLKTGDILVKLDSLLSLLPELTKEVVARHRNTTLKRSQNCSVTLYGVKV